MTHSCGRSAAGPTDTAGAAWLATAAALLLAIGMVLNDANVASLMIAFAATVIGAAMIAPAARLFRSLNERSVLTVIVVSLALEVVAIPARAPNASPGYSIALVALGLVGLHALLLGGRWRRFELALVTSGTVVLMCWMIAHTPTPDIDVYVFQQEGPRALLQGVDPFSLRFEVHAPPGSPYYAPELIEGGRTTFGFIYPPVSLLMAVPGYVVAGDYRYGAAVALGFAVVLIGLARPGPIAAGAALLLLFAPGAQQVLYWGWSDPFVILLLAATVFAAIRASRATPLALGFFIASKQYVAPLYLLGLVLLRRPRLRVGTPAMLAVPIVAAIISVIPFVLWDPESFFHSAVGMHLVQPFRADSLSVPALFYRLGLGELPSGLSFVLAAFALIAGLRWAPRTTAGFCFGSALVLIVFFLFSKQAFMHYYFLIIALLACGIAATTTDPMPRRQSDEERS